MLSLSWWWWSLLDQRGDRGDTVVALVHPSSILQLGLVVLTLADNKAPKLTLHPQAMA